MKPTHPPVICDFGENRANLFTRSEWVDCDD